MNPISSSDFESDCIGHRISNGMGRFDSGGLTEQPLIGGLILYFFRNVLTFQVQEFPTENETIFLLFES